MPCRVVSIFLVGFGLFCYSGAQRDLRPTLVHMPVYSMTHDEWWWHESFLFDCERQMVPVFFIFLFSLLCVSLLRSPSVARLLVVFFYVFSFFIFSRFLYVLASFLHRESNHFCVVNESLK